MDEIPLGPTVPQARKVCERAGLVVNGRIKKPHPDRASDALWDDGDGNVWTAQEAYDTMLRHHTGRERDTETVDETLARAITEAQATDPNATTEQIIRRVIEEPSIRAKLIKVMFKQAIKGDQRAANMLVNRAYGTPKAVTENHTNILDLMKEANQNNVRDTE